MTWHSWALYLGMEIVLCLTPGPAVLFVISQALQHGGRRSIWASLGILAGNAFYFLLSAAGLGAVLLASNALFQVIRYLGAGYLMLLGLATLLGRGLALPRSIGATEATRTNAELLRQGFLIQVANPKALLFFTALLPQFIKPDAPVGLQVLILGVTAESAEFLILALYGLFAGRMAALARAPHYVSLTNRVAGGLLAGAGLGLALTGRR